METLQQKKITLATVKSFINKNRENLYINVKSSFDGMTDVVEPLHAGFINAKADKTESLSLDYHARTQGIKGAWFVGGGRDYFQPYNENGLIGYEVSNCCGTFIIAINA